MSIAAQLLLTGSTSSSSNQPEDAAPRDFNIPTAAEDRDVPTFFGTRKLSPNIVNYAGFYRVPIIKVTEVETGGKDGGTEEISQVVGYAIFASALLGFADGFDGIREWYLDDDKVWSGSIVPAPPARKGSVAVRTGHPAQGEGSSHTGPSTIYVRQSHETEFSEYQGATGDPVPYFATGLIWARNVFVGDNATSLPNWAATCERRGAAFGDLVLLDNENDPPEKHLVNDWDMNPADIAYNLLFGFLGIPAADIDIESFRAAQDTFFEEGLGLSVLIEKKGSAESVIQNFERHTDSRIFLSPKTGKWTIRLIRGDYDPDDLPELTEDEVSDFRLNRQGSQDSFTDLVISYVPSSTWEKRTYRIINPALHGAAGGTRTKSIDLSWVTQDDVFWAAVQRLKRRNFMSFAVLRFKVSRRLKHPITGENWILEPGEALKVSWSDPFRPEVSFSGMVVRVLSVSNWGRESDYLQIEAVEDLFSVGDIDLIALPDGTTGGPDYTLTEPSAHVAVVDATAELSRTPALAVFASPPATQTADAFYCKVNGKVKGEFQIMGTGTLLADYGVTRMIDREVGFTVENAIGLDAFTSTEGAFQRMNRIAVFLHADGTLEAVGVKTLADNGGGSFTATGVIRELAGTTRSLHPSGTRVWFPAESGNNFRALARVGGEAYNTTLQVDTAPLNLNFTGQETSQNHTYGYTNITPYPVANLVVSEGASDDAIFDWSFRNRHSGWLATHANLDNARPHDGFDPEATFEIANDDNDDVETFAAPAATITDGWVPGRTYTIRAFMAGYYSEGVDITIPS